MCSASTENESSVTWVIEQQRTDVLQKHYAHKPHLPRNNPSPHYAKTLFSQLSVPHSLFISIVIRRPESFHVGRKTGDGLFIWVLITISKPIHGSQCWEFLWIINHCYPPGPPILLPHCSSYQSMKQNALFSQGSWISDCRVIYLNNNQTYSVLVEYSWTNIFSVVRMQWIQCKKLKCCLGN